MGEQEMLIDPSLRIGRQKGRDKLARRKHHLLIGTGEMVTIDIDVEKPVVGADLLLSRLPYDFNSENCHEYVGLSGYRELDFG
jgi:hypothetical protein